MMAIRPHVALLFLGMALVTYLPRMLPLVVLSRLRLPPLLLRWLGFVPVSVLAALLARELFIVDESLVLGLDNPPLLAALPTFLVAFLTRNLMGTVLTGIAATAAIRFFLQ